MMQLFVEGYVVDVNESFSTVITKAIDDIKNFSSRETSFSKTIILPGTKRNNLLFGNIFNINSANDTNPINKNIGVNFNAATSASFYIFNDNIQQIKGIFRLLEIVIDDGMIEYEAAVFGELGGFVAKMGNKKLEELDFSAYDHAYSLANITSSWNTAAAGSGYYYPLIDYGTYSTNKADWDYHTFRPALYVKEYIDKIFSMAGYTYDCALFNTTRFKSFIVPHNTKKLTKVTSDILSAVVAGFSQTVDTSITSFELVVTWDSFSGGNFTDGGLLQYFQWTPADSVNVELRLQIDGSVSADSGGAVIELRINSTVVSSIGIPPYGGPVSELLIYNGILNQNDEITLYVKTLGDVATFGFDATLSATSQPPVIAPLNLGDDVDMNYTIPKNILQKDFLSSIVKLYNLYLFESNDSDKLLNIQPFVDYYIDAEAIDWSLKIDRSKPQRIKPMSELNSRYFEFNYADDSDYYNDLYKKRYNESYGSYKYDSEFEFAKEVTQVNLIFAGTPLVGYAGEDKVYPTIFKRTGDTTVIEENVDSKIRILQAKKVTGVTSWDIKNGVTVLGSYTDYGYAGHLDDPDNPGADLNFGVVKELFFSLTTGDLTTNQFNVYWSSYMAEITDKESRLLLCTAKLSYKDMYNLDFAKLIWIDGVLYRLNKIEDFNVSNEDTCKLELLKVINRIY